MFLKDFFNFFGSLICHQIDERTIFIGSYPLPVCARDTGIYLGFFISSLFLFVSGTWKADKPPKIKHSIILCSAMIPMMVDGVSSYIGLWSSNNFIRVISGGMFGISFMIFLVFVRNYKPQIKGTLPPVNSMGKIFLLWILLIFISVLIYYNILISWSVISTVFVLSFILVVYLFSDLIISAAFNLPANKRKLFTPAVGALFIYVLYLI